MNSIRFMKLLRGHLSLVSAFSVFLLSGGCSGPSTEKSAGVGQTEPSSLANSVALPYRLTLPGSPDQYEIMKMGGEILVIGNQERPWGQEYIIQQSRLKAEGMTLECLAGRSAVPYKPWLLLRHIETQQGLGISIAYPGNWRIQVSRVSDKETGILVDTIPDHLEVIKTIGNMPIPGALISQFQGSWDEGALPMVRYIRSHLLRKELPQWPWVEFNTWYDRYQKIDEARLLLLARKAAEIGCEVFVVDAGWYGTAEDWSKALGDWRVNQKRLPRGMEPVAQEVRNLGMKFGMWIEIENAAPDSPVGKAHPDWFLHRNGKRINERSTLNFGRRDVVAWAKSEIDRLMRSYQLDYIKMDFNTNLGNGGDPGPDSKDPLWAHYQGLISLWTYMHEKYPRLVIENCASGSLRMDAALAALTDTHWVSDEVSDYRNLAMNYAMTFVFPPEICNHWTCFPKSSPAMDLESAFRVSMMGQFGLSGSILKWDKAILTHARSAIAEYKELRPLIRQAEVYHLTAQVDVENPRTFQAAQYFVPETGESLLFAFRANDPASQFRVALKRVDPTKKYVLLERNGRREVTGENLMRGIELQLPTSGASVLVRIRPLSAAS